MNIICDINNVSKTKVMMLGGATNLRNDARFEHEVNNQLKQACKISRWLPCSEAFNIL